MAKFTWRRPGSAEETASVNASESIQFFTPRRTSDDGAVVTEPEPDDDTVRHTGASANARRQTASDRCP
jgi:hypothetical protein